MSIKDGHQNTILAIDDDPETLVLVQTTLEVAGYVAHTASSGNEGLKFYEMHWRDIKLVLLDFIMPDITGDVVLECLRNVNPDVKVLLLTGFGDDVVRKMVALGVNGHLQKPFSLPGLVQKVKDVLDAPLAACRS